MNIFILDCNPVLAAQMQCDKHVVKMALESAQLLSNCHDESQVTYKRTHYNHPCSIWARASKSDYQWLFRHGIALCNEYEFRFGKEHACKKIILSLPKFSCVNKRLFPFALAMPDEFRSSTAVKSYRKYYRYKANTIDFRYTGRNVPEWI